jgi:hypothetical protein
VAEIEGDLGAQQVNQRLADFVEQPRLDARDEGQGGPERARGRLGLRGGQQALGPPSRVRRQRRRRFEEGGGRRKPAEGGRTVSRPFQLCRDIFIRAHRGAGAMPGTAVRIEVWIRGVGQRLVDLPPFRRGCRLVDGRVHQRVPEPDPIAQLDQAG